MTVINSAYASSSYININYKNETPVVIGSILLLSVFFAVLIGFFTRKQKASSCATAPIDTRQSTLTQSKFTLPCDNNLFTSAKKIMPAAPFYREFSCAELHGLFNATNLKGQQLISLLLSGLTIDETASLKSDQIDLEMSTITVFGGILRTLTITTTLKTLFEQSDKYPVWESIKPLAFDDITQSLFCSATASGLPNPESATAEAIRHSYIIYLIRQGIPLSKLDQIVGYMDTTTLSAYRTQFTQHQTQPINTINLIHPLFLELSL